MKLSAVVITIALSLSSIAVAIAQDAGEAPAASPAELTPELSKVLQAFPAAEAGMQRYVITVPEVDDPHAHLVELIPGAQMKWDGANRMRAGYRIEEHPLEGWGYTFYTIEGRGAGMSTRMAPRPGIEAKMAFVPGEPLRVRYNPRMTIVVYVPAGAELRYRIWSAGETSTAVGN